VSHADLIRAIHHSGRQLVIAVTGGGSGVISKLLAVPGASRSVLEAVVPYSAAALESWLGGAPDQYCSAHTARAMAMAAFMRARRLAPDADPMLLVGLACTASLATDRPKRGDHRIHIGVQAARETVSYSLTLEKGRRQRAAEEAIAAELLLWAAGEACGVDATAGADPLWATSLETDRVRTAAACTDLILGSRRCIVLKPGSETEFFDSAATPRLPVVFPGAFNPLHAGHLGMAAEAERRLAQPVAWELSIANVDKPPLDFVAIRNRLAALRSEDGKRMVALTCAPTFREKAELFPGAVFVVGVDTLIRIADPRYYGGDPARRDDAIRGIADRGCGFLVFGRQLDGKFQSLADVDLPPALRTQCDEVAAADFREDVSSTEIRTASRNESAT
jgi:nicotinamide mononucleotide (NMN) deamidase PncC